MPSYQDELPDGWVCQFDERTTHPFWVDTKAKPPRSIWVHPYEDEQFLSEHPEIKARLAKSGDHLSPDDLPPPYTPRRHSYSGPSSSSNPDIRDSVSQPGTPAANMPTAGHSQKRGFFGKIKDKAIGTKEEREEAKRQEALYMQRRAEERKRQIEEMRRQQRMATPVFVPVGAAPGGGRYRQSFSPYGQQYYAAPPGRPYNYNGGYESYERYGRSRQSGFGGGGFGGAGIGLLGGLAGGLLLGDLIGGGF